MDSNGQTYFKNFDIHGKIILHQTVLDYPTDTEVEFEAQAPDKDEKLEYRVIII